MTVEQELSTSRAETLPESEEQLATGQDGTREKRRVKGWGGTLKIGRAQGVSKGLLGVGGHVF